MNGSEYFVAWPKPSFDIFILFRYFSSNREKNLIWKSNSPILAVQFQCFHLCISWLEYRIQGSRFPRLDLGHPIDFKSISNLSEVYWRYSQQYCISFPRCSYLSLLHWKPESIYRESMYFSVLFNFSQNFDGRSISLHFISPNSLLLEKYEKVQNERTM